MSSGKIAKTQTDPLYQLLIQEKKCPNNVLDFRERIKNSNLKIKTTMVANRGFHNPSLGSFSFFEMVYGGEIKLGDFFFGHFTTLKNKYLTLDQNPELNALMIEAFAWDKKKKVFNFYELRGNGKQGRWFYRGDSYDIYRDNTFLHRQIDPDHPQFGNRLRCSACHYNGGAIMKELNPPHNDWWTPERKLDFGDNIPDAELKKILASLVTPDVLKKAVVAANTQLLNPINLSLQEKLRPLFCPMEVNFQSDDFPNGAKKMYIHIPTDFFIDSRLLDQPETFFIKRTDYENLLIKLKLHFPEGTFLDADYAWLTPVKAYTDKLRIDNLIKDKLIDEKFVLAVLNIDIANPVFSQQRCHLLKYLPSYTSNWQNEFLVNLKKSSDPDAKELLDNLTDPKKDSAFYKKLSKNYVAKIKYELADKNYLEKYVRLLIERRKQIAKSEISKNPRGQILEPGFRVIFPEAEKT